VTTASASFVSPKRGSGLWTRLVADPWRLIAWGMLGFLIVFVALPLLGLAGQSFVGERSGAVGFDNYATFFGSNFFRRALINSLIVASIGTGLSLLIGMPLAYIFSRYDFSGKRWIEVAVLMSMLSPPFVGAYAWIIMFGRSGIITSFGRDLGLSMPVIYGPIGIGIASAFSLYPLVFLVVRGGLSQVNSSLEEAAASLGRKPLGVMVSVTLPLILPAIITAALLVFLGVISDFGTPAILGEGDRFPVLATLAFSLYISEIGGQGGMAATTSVVLVVLALALVFFARSLAGRRMVANEGGVAPVTIRLGGMARKLTGLGVTLIVIIANMPLLVVLVSSVLEVRGVVFQSALTLDNYAKAIAVMGNALTNSLLYASIALVVTVIVGSLLGYFVTRRTGPLPRSIDLMVMIPYVVPGTVLGIGYAQFFNGPPLFLTGTATIITIIYFVRRLPYMTRAASSIVYQIDGNLEEASASLGVPPMQGFWKIMVPLMRPGILAGASIAWVEIFNELSASIVLYTGATRTLPIAAYQQSLGGSDVGMAAAYASILIGITALALIVLTRIGGQRGQQNMAWL
jgi:iron(III) transport system permease protein